jgi:hypothetical protein
MEYIWSTPVFSSCYNRTDIFSISQIEYPVKVLLDYRSATIRIHPMGENLAQENSV